jgi:hypothetical protein
MSLADDNPIRQLRKRINFLEEELRQLREDLVPVKNPFWHLFSYQHSALLLGIYSKRLATYAFLDAICSQSGHINRGEGEDYARHRVKVAIFKLKKKLREHGIEVCTRRGLGYYLDDENRAKLEKLMEGKDD